MCLKRGRNVASWLQADIQLPEIDFRLTPNSGHSEAHAGLPRLPTEALTAPLVAIAVLDEAEVPEE